MKANGVAALLLQHPEKYVLVNQDLCSVTHDPIHMDIVNPALHGLCVSISSLATNRGKNFTYQADAEPAPAEFQITS